MATSPLLDLPSVCWYTIVTYLNLDDLFNISLLCKPLYEFLSSQEDSLWRTHLTTFLPGLTKDIRVISGANGVNLPSEMKYLRLGVPGALRNVSPECPLGRKSPSIRKLNTLKNQCLLLRRIKRLQDNLVAVLLHTSVNSTSSSLLGHTNWNSIGKPFSSEKGIPNRLLDLLAFQEKTNLTLPIDYVYFLLNHAHKFWWNPEWLRLSLIPGNGSFVFTGPSRGGSNELNYFQVITSEQLLDHEPEPSLGELVETQYDYWKYIAGERRFLRITSPCGDESERYLMLEVTDSTEADFGSVYYVNNVGDNMQVREFDEEDYMPRTPLWSHFTFTDFLQRFATVHTKINVVPHRFFYQVGFHSEFKYFLEETEIYDQPQKIFTTQTSCLHLSEPPFTLTEKEWKLEENLHQLNLKERKCSCIDDTDW